MTEARKPRVALCVFKTRVDCLDAVTILERLGTPREAVLLIVETGKPISRIISRWVAGTWTEAALPSADGSDIGWIADYHRWAPPQALGRPPRLPEQRRQHSLGSVGCGG